MANRGKDTNGSQFFIVQTQQVVTREILDAAQNNGFPVTDQIRESYLGKQGCYWLDGAHTPFGKVTEGMDVVDAIATAPLLNGQSGTPVNPVKMISITITEQE